MRNATQPELVCHLESYTLCVGIQIAGENSVNMQFRVKNFLKTLIEINIFKPLIVYLLNVCCFTVFLTVVLEAVP